METDHPQYRARQLFKLVGATPAGLDCGQTKVPNLHCQILVEENIWVEMKSRKHFFFYLLLLIVRESLLVWQQDKSQHHQQIQFNLDNREINWLSSVFQKDTVALQISVDDWFGVQVTVKGKRNIFRATTHSAIGLLLYLWGNSLHALSRLPGNVDQLDHLKLGLDDVQVVVQTRAFTPLGHDGQLRLGGVAHEQQDIHMTCFPGANKHQLIKLQNCSSFVWSC